MVADLALRVLSVSDLSISDLSSSDLVISDYVFISLFSDDFSESLTILSDDGQLALNFK